MKNDSKALRDVWKWKDDVYHDVEHLPTDDAIRKRLHDSFMKNLIPYFIQQQYQQHNFAGRFSTCSMFVDISGFTQTTEALIRSGKTEGVEVLSELLRFYFTPMVGSVYAHGGFIASFAGDAFTALFPITRPRPPVAKRALTAAYAINRFFTDHPVYRSNYGDFDFGVKVGLAIGDTEWGIVGQRPTPRSSLRQTQDIAEEGNSSSLTYYFKGDAIDGCAQAEHQAETCEIWATRDFSRLVEHLIKQNTERTSHVCIDVVTPDRFPQPVRLKTWSIDPEVLRVFYGDELVQFQQAEFRKIVAVFIAFDNVEDLNAFVSLILQELRTYGGTLSRLDFGDKGGNLLFFFGAPVLYENTPTRALQFILSVKNPPFGGQSGKAKLRAGIATGVSYCGFNGSDLRAEFTCLGNAVNQAARFMMKAAWGQVIVDRELAGNPQFQTHHLGDFVYKGRGASIPTYELLRQKTLVDTFYQGAMVGRERELRQLEHMVRPIFQGKFGGVVYVDGVAGMGKSRLVNELRRRLESKVTWWYLPCDEILCKSFNPIVSFLSEYFAQSDDHSAERNTANFEKKLQHVSATIEDEAIRKELIRTTSILGALLNLHWENSLYEQLDAKGRYDNTLSAVKNLVKAASLRQPVILEVEDGHWIDPDTRHLLDVLTRNVEEVPFVILTACRYHDDGSAFDFGLKEVREQRIALQELDRAASTALIKETFETQNVPDATVEVVWARSQGNPFFIEQILRYMQEQDVLDSEFKVKPGVLTLPSSIGAVIIARIDRLRYELQEVVKTASVLGREFVVTILAAMLGKQSIMPYLSEGRQEMIWEAVSEMQYLFKHALIRETVYEMQLRARRRELHLLAAETIEAVYAGHLQPYYADLAFHYEHTDNRDKAVDYLQKAGDEAKSQYQNQHALELYDRLLLHLKGFQNLSGVEIDTLLKKVEILRLTGSWNAGREVCADALRLAEQCGDTCRKGWAGLTLGILLRESGEYDKAMASFEQARVQFEAVNERAGIGRVLKAMGIVYKDRGDYDLAMPCSQQALTICEELGDTLGMAKNARNMGIVYFDKSDYEAAIRWYQKSLQLCEILGEKLERSRILNNMGNCHREQGDSKTTLAYFEQSLRISEELGDTHGMAIVMNNIGIVYTELKGDYDAALTWYQKSLQISEELGDKRGMSKVLNNIGECHRLQGNYDAAMKYYEKALTIHEALGNKSDIAITLGNIGHVYKAQGGYTKALDHYDRAITIFRTLERKYFLSEYIIGKAEALFSLQCYEEAQALNAEGLQIAEEIGVKEDIFKGKVLSAKIDFALGNGDVPRRLEGMLQQTQGEADIASLHYELWKMSHNDEQRQAALTLYHTLYETTPNIDYKTRMEEMKNDKD